jgi:hypothetical protein
MYDPSTITNLIVGAFLFILALIIAFAAFLDRSVPQPVSITARSRVPQDTSSSEAE